MSLDDPVIITCADSVVLAKRDRRPAIPCTVLEHGTEAGAMRGAAT